MTEKKSVWRSPAIRVVRFLVLVYLGLVVLMGVFQRMYIYYPTTDDLASLEEEAGRIGLEPWRSSDGAFLGWKPPGSAGGNRLVVFHGNAGHALIRDYYVHQFEALEAGAPWDVYLFEYPGYGGRDGRPSEKIFVEAALAATDSLLEEDDAPLFLLGESLGGGVATRVAAERAGDVDGVFLVTPFTRLGDVGAAHFPFLPVRLLLRDRYDNERHLARYAGPVAVLLAAGDEVVPARLGRELYEGFEGRKRLREIEGADHNTLMNRTGVEVWEDLAAFLVDE